MSADVYLQAQETFDGSKAEGLSMTIIPDGGDVTVERFSLGGNKWLLFGTVTAGAAETFDLRDIGGGVNEIRVTPATAAQVIIR